MTVQSLTLSDKSVRSFLDARDSRQDALAQVLSEGYSATLILSLNIPGAEKSPPGSAAIFFWMLGELSGCFPDLVTPPVIWDALGPCAIMGLDMDPVSAKSRCIALETSRPAARLIDLDVYSASGIQIDRARLDLPRRTCLVCDQSAVECIRSRRHSVNEVIGKAHELLAHFRA